MPWDWDHLRFVLAVGRAGSATAAARQLGVDKATVGRRLAAAEAAIGVRLFHRRSSGYTLTEQGTAAVAAAHAIAASVDELEAALGGASPRAYVRLTAPVWFTAGVVMPALPELVRTQPTVDLVCTPSTRIVNLAQREADVAIRNVVPDQQSMFARKAGELGSALYAARSFVRQYGMPADRAGVLARPLLGYESTVSFLPGFKWLDTQVAEKRVVLRVSDTLALCAAAEAGLGSAVLPCFVGDAAANLVRIPCEPAGIERIWVVAPIELRAAPGVRPVVDFIVAAWKRNARALRGS